MKKLIIVALLTISCNFVALADTNSTLSHSDTLVKYTQPGDFVMAEAFDLGEEELAQILGGREPVRVIAFPDGTLVLWDDGTYTWTPV